MTQKQRLRRGDGLAPFLALRESIGELLDAGYTAKKIYERLDEKLNGMSYRQFMRYVKQYFPTGSHQTKDVEEIIPTPAIQEPASIPPPLQQTPKEKGFSLTIDPTRKFE